VHQKCPTPTFDPHCSNSTNLIFVKFPRLLGGPRNCRTPSKNRNSVDRVPRKSRPKYAKKPKKPKLKPPYLPQIGAESPQTKTVSLRIASAIRSNGQVWGEGPKPKSAPTPKFRPPLLKFHDFNFHEIFSIGRASTWLSNAVKKSKI